MINKKFIIILIHCLFVLRGMWCVGYYPDNTEQLSSDFVEEVSDI